MVKAIVGLSLATACSACTGNPAPERSQAGVPVTLRDFRVRVPNGPVTAGMLSFDIHNRGPSTHEFLVVRTDLGSSELPLGPDGLTVDEESPELHFVEEDPNLDIGDARVLTVRLAPGHYVLYCNLEGHYLGGMHASLVVT
jgi:uncharacterized cupredoxin-like copper-binding protein